MSAATLALAAAGAAALAVALTAGDVEDQAVSPAVQAASQRSVATAQTGPFVLGVQTHFGQNWPADRLAIARKHGATMLRDGASWAVNERSKGVIALAENRLAPLRQACRAGVKVMLTIVPVHPAYDNGKLVTSDEGVAAFGRYLDTIAQSFGSCLIGIEVGNEINGTGELYDRSGLPGAYTRLLERSYAPFKAKHPDVAIVGGSTNAIGTGFLNKLFAAGMLDHVDAVAVHPYRRHSESLSWEIRHLQGAMRRHGRIVPIWASELGDNFERPSDAASALVKMATLLSGLGVENASWYALTDQKWFPTSGLVTATGREKPAAGAFAMLQRELLVHGRPVQVHDGDLVSIWRFAPDRWVIWGAPRDLVPAKGSQVFDAAGNPLSGPLRTGQSPLIVFGPQPRLAATPVLADSLLQFGAAPWSYHAGTAEAFARREPAALQPLDSDFQTSLGSPTLRPLRLDASTGATLPVIPAVVRYTAPADMNATLLGCFSPGRNRASTVRASISIGNREVTSAVIREGSAIRQDIALRRGETLDLRFVAETGSRGHTFGYRVRLFEPGQAPADCPADIAGWS